MTTANAPATTTPKKTASTPAERFKTIKGEVHNWNLGNDPTKGRKFINNTHKYGEIADWVHAETFQYETMAGWQREVSESHVKNLREEMENNNFTPTPWAVTINEWHDQSLKHSSEADKSFVNIRVGSNNDHKLLITDGNHRRNAIKTLLQEAEQIDDKDMKERLLNLPIAVTIHLNHEKTTGDFLNLQKSRPVARNVTKSMEILSGLIDDEEDYPLMRFATDAIIKLNNNTRSHLAGTVAFGEARMTEVQYASLVTPGASTLLTTVTGGAKIARHFDKSPAWLVDKYIEAFEGLRKFATPTDPTMGDDAVREIFSQDMMLVPVGGTGIGNKGTRGGSHLLIGIANCYAYVMANRTDSTPTDQDLKWLAEAVDDIFNVDPKHSDFGGSAGDKRRWMGKFVRKYFKHAKFTIKADGTTVEYPPFEKRIPAEFIELLSTSTMDVDTKSWKAYKAEKSGVTPKKRGRKTKSQEEAYPEGAKS